MKVKYSLNMHWYGISPTWSREAWISSVHKTHTWNKRKCLPSPGTDINSVAHPSKSL